MENASKINNEDLLRTILLNMRYVKEETINRFMYTYRLCEDVFKEKPELLLKYAQHMFGPGQGETALMLFDAMK